MGLKLGADGSGSFSLINARTYIQTLAAIARHSGTRLSPFLVQVVPAIMYYTKNDKEDELRESCLQAFEALVSRCYTEITPFIPQVSINRSWRGVVVKSTWEKPKPLGGFPI